MDIKVRVFIEDCEDIGNYHTENFEMKQCPRVGEHIVFGKGIVCCTIKEVFWNMLATDYDVELHAEWSDE